MKSYRAGTALLSTSIGLSPIGAFEEYFPLCQSERRSDSRGELPPNQGLARRLTTIPSHSPQFISANSSITILSADG